MLRFWLLLLNLMSTWLVCAHTYVDTQDSDLSPAAHLDHAWDLATVKLLCFLGLSLVGLRFRSVGAACFPRTF